MPHVIVKLWPGKSEEQKQRLAEDISAAVMKNLGYGPDAVSVSLEEIAPADWLDEVFVPEIELKPKLLYKKPGYSRADLPDA